jgi:hypothetical protein
MEDTILLSEIHPLGFHLPRPDWNPLAQAYYWHNLITREDINTKQYDFVGAIHLIERTCTEQSKQLILRDWAFLDFISLPDPSYRFMLNETLSHAFEIIDFGLVRHPVHQWISKQKISDFDHITLDVFLKGYFEYAKKITVCGFIRFEDFLKEPEKQMRIICEKLQLKFDRDFITKWANYNKITGDFHKESRGLGLHKIAPLPQLPIENELIQQFHQNNYCQEALHLLNYADLYG